MWWRKEKKDPFVKLGYRPIIIPEMFEFDLIDEIMLFRNHDICKYLEYTLEEDAKIYDDFIKRNKNKLPESLIDCFIYAIRRNFKKAKKYKNLFNLFAEYLKKRNMRKITENYLYDNLNIEMFENNEIDEILTYSIREFCDFVKSNFLNHIDVFDDFVGYNEHKMPENHKECLFSVIERNLDKVEHYDNLLNFFEKYMDKYIEREIYENVSSKRLTIDMFKREEIDEIVEQNPSDFCHFIEENLLKHSDILEKFFEKYEKQLPESHLQCLFSAIEKNFPEIYQPYFLKFFEENMNKYRVNYDEIYRDLKNEIEKEIYENYLYNNQLTIEMFQDNNIEKILSYNQYEFCSFLNSNFLRYIDVFDKFIKYNEHKLPKSHKDCMLALIDRYLDKAIDYKNLMDFFANNI